MISMTLKLDQVRPDGMGILGWRATLGAEISRWCKEQGMVPDQDYDWSFIPKSQEVRFRFYGVNDSYATLFALRWAQYL